MSPNVLERLRATDAALKAKDTVTPQPSRPEGWGGLSKPNMVDRERGVVAYAANA